MNPSLITSASRPVTMLVVGLLLVSLAGCLPRAAASTSSGQRPRALELSGSATQRLYPGGPCSARRAHQRTLRETMP